MELKGSRTEANLLAAIAGESIARNKYTFFAEAAKKQGYEQMADTFLLTADNEMAHARLWFQTLSLIGSLSLNLESAAKGEHEEWECMYPKFAKEAREEGFEKIAKLFEGVAAVETEHEKRYLALLAQANGATVFKKEQQTLWICRNCGHEHTGTDAPTVCPVCSYPRSYFEVKVQTY